MPDLVAFGGIPTVLAATGALAVRRVTRAIMVVQAIVTLTATLWLLDRIGCLP